MFVEPTNVCNFRCEFCPESFPDYQEQVGYYQLMPAGTWDRIVEGLCEWGVQLRVMRFYHLGEPLLNPRLPRMLITAKEKGIVARTEVTTNGSMLNAERARALVLAGLDYLRLSVYAVDDAGYRVATHSRYALTDIQENIRQLRRIREELGRENPSIYAQFTALDATQGEAFREQWKDLADDLAVETLHNWPEAPHLVQLGQQTKTVKRVCPKPFYELSVKANGDVVCCCIDWSGQLKVGNVLENSLQEIWEGFALQRIQALHAAGKRDELDACRDCTMIYMLPDSLESLVP